MDVEVEAELNFEDEEVEAGEEAGEGDEEIEEEGEGDERSLSQSVRRAGARCRPATAATTGAHTRAPRARRRGSPGVSPLVQAP